MKNLKITIVLIGYCITSMIYASQAQQKTKKAAAAASSLSSSSASVSASGSSSSSSSSASSAASSSNSLAVAASTSPKKIALSPEKQKELNHALLSACCSSFEYNEQTVKDLLGRGANPNSYYYINRFPITCLNVAVFHGNEKYARLLMQYNVNPYWGTCDRKSSDYDVLCCINHENVLAEFRKKNNVKFISDLNEYVAKYTKEHGKAPVTIESPGDIFQINNLK